jgi:hypothetical protein
MLAYQQQLAHHFASAAAGRRSPSPNESRVKRSMSPPEAYHQKETFDYVRTHIRRRSLSRSNSPVRSHSPTYHHHTSQEHHHFLIKRSLSEEDLRSAHERRRLSLEQTSSTEFHHAITHRPQILMNYRHPQNDDQDGDSDSEKIEKSDEQDEDAPLDLSMGSKKRRGRTDSGTDSDDSTGTGEEGRGNEGRAYKKSLMKRYCESQCFILKIIL